MPSAEGAARRATVVSISGTDAEAAVGALLHRVLPQYAEIFDLHLVPGDLASPHGFFRVCTKARRVHIEGASAVELASGFHWWLKHHAGCSISWDATGGLQVNAEVFSSEGLDAIEAAGAAETIARAVPHTFYQNVVTLSYSFAFWEWDRWERELDWMALQGINLSLMPLGAEAVWLQTFSEEFGLAPDTLADFFPGPAFLAWGRMGNIQGWGGPLPMEYISKQAALGQRVVARMRELGIAPVFPAFAGFVPRALAAAHPGARVVRSSNWCRFPDAFCCPLLLDPQDPLFARVGAAYTMWLRRQFGPEPGGRPSYYIADSFNEMRPSSSDPSYLSAISGAVYSAMSAADPGCVWIMQAWLFFSDSAFWQPPQIKALLGGVPVGRLLLLDLFAEDHPIWSRTDAFYGYPYIWVMLHNFGGNNEMFGALPAVAEGVSSAMAASAAAAASGAARAGGFGGGNLVGIGMAPEGIEQNPVVYEFMAEMAYQGQAEWLAGGPAPPSRRAPSGKGPAAAAKGALQQSGAMQEGWAPARRTDTTNHTTTTAMDMWFEAYAARRYAGAGAAPQKAARALWRAWRGLGRSAYACSDRLHSTVCDIPTSRPGLCRAEIMGWGLMPHVWYDPAELRAALGDLLAAAAAHPPLAACSSFRYDTVDAARELLSKAAGAVWAAAAGAYVRRDAASLAAAGGALEALLGDMERLLASHEGFMLGPAVARARAYAGGAEGEGRRRHLELVYEWNLRTQLTIWGTSDSGDSEVSDYANKQWAGLVGGFYAPRWRAWLSRLQQDLREGRAYDAAAWRAECLAFSRAWAAACGGAPPPVLAEGDPVVLARRALDLWGAVGAAMAPAVASAAPAHPELAAAAAAAAEAVSAAAVAAATTVATVVAAEAPMSPVVVAPEQAVNA